MRSLVVAFICAFAVSAPAQNLVPNPDFQNFTTCPITIGQTASCVAWSSPTSATPDYHHSCHTGPIVGVPNNTWGTQAAHAGTAYASCIVYKPSTGVLGEYIEAPLSSPLVAGQTYQVSFWVSLTDKSRHGIADLGAYLSVGSVAVSSSVFPLPYTPQVQNPLTNVITDKSGWVQIQDSYTAAGGEDHIVIGCFVDWTAATAAYVGGLNDWANYYIDDVSVVPEGGGGQVGTDHLIGWSDDASPLSQGYLDIQDVDGGCVAATTRCRTSNLVQATTAYAGGTAYDPRRQSVWASDGTRIAEYYLDEQVPCRRGCAAFAAVVVDPAASVSGLAHSESTRQLFQVATRPGYLEITTYDTSVGPCPGRSTTCTRTLPAGAVAAGLAHDEVRGLLYIAVSSPLPAGGWSTLLWIARQADPCNPLCEVSIFRCSNQLVTGLAYESARGTLYATDGRITESSTVGDPFSCAVRTGGCCAKQISPVYRGLAVVPGWQQQIHGKPCSVQPCPSCPSITIGTTGDPSLGGSFQVSLENGPTGAFAWLFLSVGGCSSPYPLPPAMCGDLYTVPVALLFPPLPLTGIASCTGRAAHNVSLPAVQQLAGVRLCFQWFFGCGGPGVGVSQAVEFPIVSG